jgi:hypothetical protein
LKLTHAANLSTALALISPLLLLCGFVFRLSFVPSSEIARVTLISNILLAAGAASVATTFWLSGFVFLIAPRRALASVLIIVAPIAVYLFFVVRPQL